MAAETVPTAPPAASSALVDMTNPVALARLASEKGSAPLHLRLLLRVVKKANGMVRCSDGSLRRRLADLMEYKVPARQVPDRRGVSSKDVVVNTQTGLWVRIYLPQASTCDETGGYAETANGAVKAKKRRVIFHFHGGGFVVLSADTFTYDIFCRRLCRRSEAVVISVNYRRAPEHRYPVAYDDCYAALEWMEGYKGDLFMPHDLDLSQCVLMGDSAGGNIVHHVGCRWVARDSSQSNHSPLQVVAHVLLFPFFGGEERTPAELRLRGGKGPLVSVENTDWHWRAFLPPGSNRDHPASNVFGPNAPDISSLPLPRSLVTISEFDMLKDWQLRYAQGLGNASKSVRLLYYTGGVHCFHIMSNSELSSTLLSDIISFINDSAGEQIQTCVAKDHQ
eukprot:c19232_g1_i1 orf=171-1349(+)